MTTTQAPSVGRIVHYRSYGTPNGEFTPECRAAIITAVVAPEGATEEDGVPSPAVVSLCAINPTGLFFHESCSHAEGSIEGGTWHWPERTDEPHGIRPGVV